MKKAFTRFATLIMAVFTMAIIAALPVTAFAAEDEIAPLAISEESSVNYDSDNDDIMTLSPISDEGTVIQPLGATPAGGEGAASGSGSANADTAYQSVVNVIITWVRRIGAFVAFIGGVLLALGFKTDDADKKENGVKTMVAGFVVWAICGSIGLFHLFD